MRSAPARQLGTDCVFTPQGAEIVAVKPGSPAHQIGLEIGDIIIAVFGYPTHSVELWERLMSGDNGYVKFDILDVRTGAVRKRYLSLGRSLNADVLAR